MASRGKTHTFGHHVENVFYLKDFMTWLSLWDVIRHFCFSGRGHQVFLVRFVKRKAPYKIRCHVEINLKLIHMAFGYDVR